MATQPSDYVFKQVADGKLELVGDFEGLYKNFANPWNQAADDGSPMSQYYAFSRTQVVSAIQRRVRTGGVSAYPKGLEIGCGHGHVVRFLSYMTTVEFDGLDISPSAIDAAAKWYPQHKFFVGDVTEPWFTVPKVKYDVIVLGQVLWYVMHVMEQVLTNCHAYLNPSGLLIISQGFIQENQRYGLDIAEGFPGALKLIMQYGKYFQLIESRYEDALPLPLNDGIITMRKVG